MESNVDPRSLLTPRRAIDDQNSLWTVFNVLQENTMKGDVRFPGMARKARKLTNIGKITETNLGLWQEAANIAAGK
jgi:hypothetical protein